MGLDGTQGHPTDLAARGLPSLPHQGPRGGGAPATGLAQWAAEHRPAAEPGCTGTGTGRRLP